MTTADLQPPIDIPVEPFDRALSERYLVYALSTITARSLPDARDGLKPVQRRLLWAMRLLRLDPGQGFKKCARVVGDVIGKYHPHGDQSVYDAMVRLAQDFALRYPLVEGQGNFGNVDGDGPAAMRYTEARLTRAALLLMEGVDEETVPFRPTYNGEEEEPAVLPAAFPHLLANGAQGIAVGMATAVPPHNVAEIVAAARLLVDRPDTPLDRLVALMPGPDFPTGGLIVDPPATVAEAYRTGRGSLRLRARHHVETERGGAWSMVVTEIPFQVPKARLIEQLAQLVEERRLPVLDDVRDESDAEIRIVLVPRARTVDPDMLAASLFRLTDLETRVSVNLNVLADGRTPGVMSLAGLIGAWVDHRRAMLVARSRHRLAAIARRLEIVDGILVVFPNLDEVIRIVREEDEPRAALMAAFGLSETQADAILNLRLRALRRLEEEGLLAEGARLREQQGRLERLLGSDQRQRTALKRELDQLAEAYAPDTPLGRRRTGFAEAVDRPLVPLHAMVAKEPLTLLVSRLGWVKTAKGHLSAEEAAAQKWKEGDGLAHALATHSQARAVLIASDGRAFTLLVHQLPGGRGHGEPLSLLVDWPQGAGVVAVAESRDEGGEWLLLASDGRGFVAPAAKLVAETRKGRQLMTARAGATLARALAVPPGHDHVALVGENRRLLIVALAPLPRQERGQGVQLQRYRDGGLADATTLTLADGLSWPMGGAEGRTRTETDLGPWLGARGGAGRAVPIGFPRSGRFQP